MVDSRKIMQRASELGINQRIMAETIGIAQASMSLKINNKRPIMLDEAEKLQKLMQIPDADFCHYFFCA